MFLNGLLKKIIRPIVLSILSEKESNLIQGFKNLTEHEDNTIFKSGFTVINRQKKPSSIKIGAYSVIKSQLFVMGYGGNITIGNYSYIGENSRIWSGEKVVIGNNVMISHNVNIIDTNSHQIDYLERSRAFKRLIENGPDLVNFNIDCGEIFIEDYAWINFNSTVLKGVRIGKGAIIGPNSVVIEDIPPFTFYAGNPAKFIKNIK